ncbi:TPA: hypothetical protein WN373_000908 [Neisseria gonorrhoeae]
MGIRNAKSKETVLSDKFPHRQVWIPAYAGMTAAGIGGFGGVGGFGGLKPTACISELPYHSDKPPGRHPRPPKADNRCAAQGAAGQPIGTTGQLPDNTTECKAG